MSKSYTEQEIEQLLALAKSLDCLSLDMEYTGAGHDGTFTLGDTVVDIQPGPQEIVEQKETIEHLKNYISLLPARESHVLMLKYGLYDGKYHSLQEIGTYYNLSRERIRQVETKALDKLCKLLYKNGIYNRNDL